MQKNFILEGQDDIPKMFQKLVFRLRQIQGLNHLVYQTMKDMLEVFDMLTQKITRLDRELLKIAHQEKDARLLKVSDFTYTENEHFSCLASVLTFPRSPRLRSQVRDRKKSFARLLDGEEI